MMANRQQSGSSRSTIRESSLNQFALGSKIRHRLWQFVHSNEELRSWFTNKDDYSLDQIVERLRTSPNFLRWKSDLLRTELEADLSPLDSSSPVVFDDQINDNASSSLFSLADSREEDEERQQLMNSGMSSSLIAAMIDGASAFLGENYLERAVELLSIDHSSMNGPMGEDLETMKYNTLRGLLHLPPLDIFENEYWADLKAALKTILSNDDLQKLNQSVIRLLVKLFNSSNHAASVEAFILLADHLTDTFTSKIFQFRVDQSGRRLIFEDGGDVLRKLKILITMALHVGKLSPRYSPQHLTEISGKILELLETGLVDQPVDQCTSQPPSFTPFMAFSWLDAGMEWWRCWMHGMLGRRAMITSLEHHWTVVEFIYLVSTSHWKDPNGPELELQRFQVAEAQRMMADLFLHEDSRSVLSKRINDFPDAFLDHVLMDAIGESRHPNFEGKNSEFAWKICFQLVQNAAGRRLLVERHRLQILARSILATNRNYQTKIQLLRLITELLLSTDLSEGAMIMLTPCDLKSERTDSEGGKMHSNHEKLDQKDEKLDCNDEKLDLKDDKLDPKGEKLDLKDDKFDPKDEETDQPQVQPESQCDRIEFGHLLMTAVSNFIRSAYSRDPDAPLSLVHACFDACAAMCKTHIGRRLVSTYQDFLIYSMKLVKEHSVDVILLLPILTSVFIVNSESDYLVRRFLNSSASTGLWTQNGKMSSSLLWHRPIELLELAIQGIVNDLSLLSGHSELSLDRLDIIRHRLFLILCHPDGSRLLLRDNAFMELLAKPFRNEETSEDDASNEVFLELLDLTLCRIDLLLGISQRWDVDGLIVGLLDKYYCLESVQDLENDSTGRRVQDPLLDRFMDIYWKLQSFSNSKDSLGRSPGRSEKIWKESLERSEKDSATSSSAPVTESSSETTPGSLIGSFIQSIERRGTLHYDSLLWEGVQHFSSVDHNRSRSVTFDSTGITKSYEAVMVYGKNLGILNDDQALKNLPAFIQRLHNITGNPDTEDIDWFSVIIYFIFDASIQGAEFLHKFVSSPHSLHSWPEISSGYNFSAAVTSEIIPLIETILENEQPKLVAVFSRHVITVSNVVQFWLNQCFLNILDWSEICNYIVMSVIGGKQYQAFFCCCIFHQKGHEICERAHDGKNGNYALHSFLIKPISFRLRDSVSHVTYLAQKYT